MRASDDPKPKIMVISTGTPERPLTDSGTLRQGKTGQVIQELTGAGMYCIGADNPEEEFKDRVGNNSWVMITGHGREGGGFSKLIGASLKKDEQGRNLTVECDASELAHLIIGNQLHAGDKINLMLFVCHSAESGAGKSSFAEQLAQELSKKEINSHILAVAGICPRLGKKPDDGSIEYKAEPSYKAKSEVIIFDTENQHTQRYTPVSKINIRKDGVHESINPHYNIEYCNNQGFANRVDNLFEELLYKEYPFDVSVAIFLMNDAQAENYLRTHPRNQMIIHLSSSANYQVSYFDGNEIKRSNFPDLKRVEKFMKSRGLEVERQAQEMQHSGARLGLFALRSGSSDSLELSSTGKRLRDVSTSKKDDDKNPDGPARNEL